MSDIEPVLKMDGISKQFTGVRALSNVQFRLYPGEVHALMGENGAGKSTLIKVLTGVYSIDSGEVLLEGKPIHVLNPHHAQDLGISTVYQEVNLCPNLSVTENIFIGRETTKWGRIDWKSMHHQAEQLLKRLDLDIDVKKLLSSYSVAIQQMVAVARALSVQAKVLILDEPTSSLDLNEVKLLFDVIRKLKQEGLAIVFVSHFIDQIYEISDRITVLRNGEWVGEYKTKELPRIDLVSKMIGKQLNETISYLKADSGKKENEAGPFISTKQLSKKGAIEPFDLEIRPGEVVSFAGLLGSGRTETARLLFGADRADDGEMLINDKPVQIHSPKQAISHGIAFCSEDRKVEGIIEDLTVRENIILALQGTKGWFEFISKKKQIEIAEQYIKVLNINPPQPEQLVKNLSGGNQQKVLLARWLITNPQLLILDEPTRGIDIGAKAEIMKLIIQLSEQGKSILFISSELEELLRCAEKIIVLRDRSLVSVLANDGKVTHQDIMVEIAGGAS